MKDIKKIDKFLLILVALFCVFGLIMIFSASSATTVLRYNLASSHFFVNQLIFIILGVVIGFIILLVPTSNYYKFIYIWSIFVIVLLLIVLINGKATGGSQSWIEVPIIHVNLQPSEFAKTALIVLMAVHYDLLYNHNYKKPLLYFVPVAMAAIMALLILLEPDLGSLLIFVILFIAMFFSVPFVKNNRKKIFKWGAIALAIVGLFCFAFSDKIFTAKRMARFNFTAPCTRYEEDTGYQVCNAFIAISNGGLFGVGLGNSSQKYLYLPESHTDMIFAIICEECGAITGIVVIVGYGLLLLKLFRTAKEADNLRTSIIAYGAFWYFALHILVNLLGLLALMPLTGVPLPFLSYGGSYTLNAVVMIFIVQRVIIENKKNKIKRELSSI